jgi:hypothetical protein
MGLIKMQNGFFDKITKYLMAHKDEDFAKKNHIKGI